MDGLAEAELNGRLRRGSSGAEQADSLATTLSSMNPNLCVASSAVSGTGPPLPKYPTLKPKRCEPQLGATTAKPTSPFASSRRSSPSSASPVWRVSSGRHAPYAAPSSRPQRRSTKRRTRRVIVRHPTTPTTGRRTQAAEAQRRARVAASWSDVAAAQPSALVAPRLTNLAFQAASC